MTILQTFTKMKRGEEGVIIFLRSMYENYCQMIMQRKLPEPAAVTGDISIQNSHGCDQIIKNKISHKISEGTALYLLSFVLLSPTEKN